MSFLTTSSLLILSANITHYAFMWGSVAFLSTVTSFAYTALLFHDLFPLPVLNIISSFNSAQILTSSQFGTWSLPLQLLTHMDSLALSYLYLNFQAPPEAYLQTLPSLLLLLCVRLTHLALFLYKAPSLQSLTKCLSKCISAQHRAYSLMWPFIQRGHFLLSSITVFPIF